MKTFSLFAAALALIFAAALPAYAGKDKAPQDIPASAKFAKIKVGMSKQQVIDLIGIWNDYEVYSTGKSFIPFYHGKDSVRNTFYYKGEGTLTIGGNDRVLEINYDPSEDGYK